MSVLFVNQRSSVFGPPSGGLRGNVCDSSLIGKFVVDIFFLIIEHFSLALTAEALWPVLLKFGAKY